MYAEKIKSLRLKRNWSQSLLAKKLKVAPSTYGAWEKGKKIPAQRLAEIAKIFGVSTSYLLGDEDLQRENLKKAIYYLEEGIDLLKRGMA